MMSTRVFKWDDSIDDAILRGVEDEVRAWNKENEKNGNFVPISSNDAKAIQFSVLNQLLQRNMLPLAAMNRKEKTAEEGDA